MRRLEAEAMRRLWRPRQVFGAHRVFESCPCVSFPLLLHTIRPDVHGVGASYVDRIVFVHTVGP